MTVFPVNPSEMIGDASEMIDTLQTLLSIERERADALKEAVKAARRTGIAVGMVMAQNGIDDDEAFSRLHAASSGVHAQLQEIVEAVIAGRRLI